jgi:DNA modification methylase
VKPYHSQDGVTLYCGDCREILPTLVGVDAMVTDAPYGIGLRNGDVDGHRSDRWDSIEGDHDSAVALEALRWAEDRNIPTVAFASPWNPWPGAPRNQIVWDKGGAVGGGGDISTCLKRSWELIQVYRNGPMSGPRDESVWRHPITPLDTALHICAKPLGLMLRLIERFTPPLSLLVDPFAGSGSTLVAAKLAGRRAIGIEINEVYCEIAAQRLRQGVLFGVGKEAV